MPDPQTCTGYRDIGSRNPERPERRCDRTDTLPCTWCLQPRCPDHRDKLRDLSLDTGHTGVKCPYPRHA